MPLGSVTRPFAERLATSVFRQNRSPANSPGTVIAAVSLLQLIWPVRAFSGSPTTELPDVDGRPDEFTILGWELEPGDAVFFHMLTLHAAGGVDGANRRRVLSVRFLGDDIVHAPRPWATSPDFPGLDAELPAGAPMDHPLFPVLWPPPPA